MASLCFAVILAAMQTPTAMAGMRHAAVKADGTVGGFWQWVSEIIGSHWWFFKHDYPHDEHPNAPDHFKGPFPHVQTADEFDRDYVHDTKTDGGEWRLQEEYDRLRLLVPKLKEKTAELKKAWDEERLEYEKATMKMRIAQKEAGDLEGEAKSLQARLDKLKKDTKSKSQDLKSHGPGTVADARADLRDKEKALLKAKKQEEAAESSLEKVKAQDSEEEGTLATDDKKTAKAKNNAERLESAAEDMQREVELAEKAAEKAHLEAQKQKQILEKMDRDFLAAEARLRAWYLQDRQMEADGKEVENPVSWRPGDKSEAQNLRCSVSLFVSVALGLYSLA